MSNATPRRIRVEPGIYRRPSDDRLEIGWRDAQSKQRWRVVDGGIKAARAALAQEHAKRARSERVASNPRLTFNAAADAWWDARVVRLRPATHNAYGAALKHLRHHFGRQRMTHIAPTDVAKYIAKKQSEGLKGWTIKGHMTVLSSVFTYAARHLGLTAQNPVSLLDRVERPSSDDEKPKRVMNADELDKLLNAVDDRYRMIFDLAAETGCRLAEALGLAWENVSLEEQTVEFTHQLDRKGKRVPLKTNDLGACWRPRPVWSASCASTRSARHTAARTSSSSRPARAPVTTTETSAGASLLVQSSAPTSARSRITTEPSSSRRQRSMTCATLMRAHSSRRAGISRRSARAWAMRAWRLHSESTSTLSMPCAVATIAASG